MFWLSWSAYLFTLLSDSAAKQPLNPAAQASPGTPLVRMGEPVAARIRGCFEICLGPYYSFARSLTSPKQPLIPSQIDNLVRQDPCTKPYVLNDFLFRLTKCMVCFIGVPAHHFALGRPVAARIRCCFEICLVFARSLTSPKQPLNPSQIDKMVRLDPCKKPYDLNYVLFGLTKCMVFNRGPGAPFCFVTTCCS